VAAVRTAAAHVLAAVTFADDNVNIDVAALKCWLLNVVGLYLQVQGRPRQSPATAGACPDHCPHRVRPDHLEVGTTQSMSPGSCTISMISLPRARWPNALWPSPKPLMGPDHHEVFVPLNNLAIIIARSR
jgi:hypothetical protein